jgi:predicted kinase
MNWTELSQASLDEIINWSENQPWCRAMAACQQDAGWHAEGDVWTHTQMVCRQLPLLTEWSQLSARDRIILIFTALFHDSGKPQTSHIDEASGRIRSPKHAIVGEHLSRKVLRELECPLPLREEICRMVRYHGRPAFLLEKSEPSHEVIRLSWFVSNRLLYLFALADTRGRAAEETSRPEENLEFWKVVAEELGCFDAPYAFVNPQARFLFFRQDAPNLFYIPHEKYRCTVTMLSGLPGSGKDWWLATHRPNLPVVSLDDLREELEIGATDNQGAVIQAARERCRELLRSHTSFAFNATNLLSQTRQRWIDLFADYQAQIEIICLEPPWTTLLEQNRSRSQPVPERVIQHLAMKAEPPTWAECHELRICDGTIDE